LIRLLRYFVRRCAMQTAFGGVTTSVCVSMPFADNCPVIEYKESGIFLTTFRILHETAGSGEPHTR
jgi:hypothetical protein